MLNPYSIKIEKGFNLVELLIIVTIIGILATLGIPSYKIWVANTKIRSTAESIQNGIQLARAEAVKRNAAIQFDLRGTDGAWVVCIRPAAPGSCANPDDTTTVQSRSNAEGGASSISVSTTDAVPLVFNSFGALLSPTPSAADGFIRLGVDISTSVIPAADSRDLQVLITAGGNTRMCDPATTLSSSDPRKCP